MSGGRVPHRVDWRDKLDAVDAYLDGRGGVIKIATDPEAASSLFAKLIEHRVLRAPAKNGDHRVYLQVDGDDPGVHYAENLLDALQERLEMTMEGGEPLTAGAQGGATVMLAQGARSLGKMNIHNNAVHVHYHGAGPTDAAIRKRAKKLATHIKRHAERVLVCIVFLDSHNHDPNALKQFTRLLWEPALSQLTEHGLTLIDIGATHGETTELWPPAVPDETIKLPARFAGSDRDAAIRDIAEIALEHRTCEGEEAAGMFARMMLAEDPTVRDIHAKLAGRLADMKESSS